MALHEIQEGNNLESCGMNRGGATIYLYKFCKFPSIVFLLPITLYFYICLYLFEILKRPFIIFSLSFFSP